MARRRPSGGSPAGSAEVSRFADGPSRSPGFLLWHLTLAWQRAIAAALAPLELTHVQFVLLACAWWLDDQGSPPNQIALARQAGTDVKMTSQVIRKLEAKGFIERSVDPADTRARRLRPSRQGALLARRAIVAAEAVDARFFDHDADAVTALLQRLLSPQAGPATTGGTARPPASTQSGRRTVSST